MKPIALTIGLDQLRNWKQRWRLFWLCQTPVTCLLDGTNYIFILFVK